MQIKLTQLTLENFKGIRNFTLEPSNTCLIKGANATYKTTLMDGFLWLLFDKDSEGKADFAIKTLKDGQEIPDIGHSVEGIFDIDGTTLTLKKVLKEKYTKKRGNAQAGLTGHTTDYFIDGAICGRKKDWDQQIANIIDEETFNLLTDPTYFNSDKFGQSIKPVRPAWERRRELLFSLPDDAPSDAEIITTIPGLTEILDGKSPENHRKIVKATQVKINERLDEIPARIDELEKSLTDVSGYGVEAIQVEIKGIDDQIQAMKDDTIRSNLRKQKSELQAELSELETEKDIAHRKTGEEVYHKIAALETGLKIKKADIADSLNEVARKENTIKYKKEEMVGLRNEYAEIADKKADVEDTCPTCGQALPKDQVQDAIKKENERQAWRLADINSRGKRLKTENTRLTEEIESLTKKGLSHEKDVKTLEGQIEGLKAAPAPDKPFDMTAIHKVNGELQDINEKLVENLPPDTGRLEEERNILQAQIALIEVTKTTRARIEELKAEEKKLGKEYEELESQISLLENFTVTKVDLLTGKINSQFAMARFKLFRTQINQGIEDCCETLYHGTPYNGGLSTGEQIIIGCDIISTFQKYYGVKATLWLDHKESLTSELNLDCQLISLIADKKYKELKVENE